MLTFSCIEDSVSRMFSMGVASCGAAVTCVVVVSFVVAVPGLGVMRFGQGPRRVAIDAVEDQSPLD